MSRKKAPEPDVIRFANVATKLPSSFTITNLSESDIRTMADGCVPAWLLPTLSFWVRDNPQPSDLPPMEMER